MDSFQTSSPSEKKSHKKSKSHDSKELGKSFQQNDNSDILSQKIKSGFTSQSYSKSKLSVEFHGNGNGNGNGNESGKEHRDENQNQNQNEIESETEDESESDNGSYIGMRSDGEMVEIDEEDIDDANEIDTPVGSLKSPSQIKSYKKYSFPKASIPKS